MPKLNVSDFPPVARTLLVSLAFRAIESQRPDAMLSDPRAVGLIEQFDESFLLLARKMDMDQIFTMMRARQFDTYTCSFLAGHPAASVVDIGCGLDTRFDRLDNGQMAWFGLDFPEVIELRRRLLPPKERESLLASSVLDLAWMEKLPDRPVIFLAEGVFPYLSEPDGRRLVLALAERFPGAELVFDALTPFSIWLHSLNPILRKTGARIHWGIKSGHELEAWGPGIHLLEEWYYLDRYEPRLGKYNLMRYFPLLNRLNYIVHMRLGNV